MADLGRRQQAIKQAADEVRQGSVWLRPSLNLGVESDQPEPDGVPCVVCGTTEELPNGNCKRCADLGDESSETRIVWWCDGCDDCEPFYGSAAYDGPCRNSDSAHGELVVRASALTAERERREAVQAEAQHVIRARDRAEAKLAEAKRERDAALAALPPESSEGERFVVERVQASALAVGDQILASGAIHTLRGIGHPPALASTPLDFKTDDGEWRGWATDWVFRVVSPESSGGGGEGGVDAAIPPKGQHYLAALQLALKDGKSLVEAVDWARSVVYESALSPESSQQAEGEREGLREFAQRVEDDRREPDKLLCHVQSMRRLAHQQAEQPKGEREP